MPNRPNSDAPFIVDVSARIGELVGMCCPGVVSPGLIIGLSGGPDSVALLLAARAWSSASGTPLAAAHFNHRLRPGDADRDAEFCRNLCETLDITFFEGGEDPRPLARSRGQGLEEAARHLRRGFFLGILAENPTYHCAATGHHLDDQVETVIMRLFRGTGPEGLRGILPVSGQFIHPMLMVGRTDIVTFLEECKQPWRMDSTNLEGDNTRARLRRELLPLVRGIFGPGSDAVPARLAELLQQDMEILEGITQAALSENRSVENPESLSVSGLLSLDGGLAARVLRLWLDEGKPSSMERVHVDNVLAWLQKGQSGSTLDLPGQRKLTRNFDDLHKEVEKPSLPLREAGDYRILVAKNSGGCPGPEEGIREGAGAPDDESTWRLTCPAPILDGNLRVRNALPGDRIQPFGLEGTKKLSDLLREHRLPREDRADVLVVTDDSGILWVVGLARSERTRLLPSSEQTVTITVAKRSDHPKQGNDI